MGTRAVFTFTDLMTGTYHVYTPHDGYPAGAQRRLNRTIEGGLTWELPRFEADEFAAAFIATNKVTPSSLRLTLDPRNHADIEFWYEVFPARNSQLIIRVHEVDNTQGQFATKVLYYGRVKDWQPLEVLPQSKGAPNPWLK